MITMLSGMERKMNKMVSLVSDLVSEAQLKAYSRLSNLLCLMSSKLRESKGQGTTEYAILVGVLVVIAIIAVVAFRGKLQELWNAISDGVNSL